jgi:excisionase family DNA binding protein
MRPGARDCLTIAEAAESIGMSRDVIYEAIGRGELSHRMAGGAMYVRRAQFTAWAAWLVRERPAEGADPRSDQRRPRRSQVV